METIKGFITVATGDEKYYRMAHNLLLSYRYHAKTQTPFAILCDRQNEWTSGFDQVIVIDNPECAMFDKLRILDLSPFDETIFIDADSLAYRDLNRMWEYFSNGPDVCVLGAIYPVDDERGWWDFRDLGVLKSKVDYKMVCQGGVYYVRNNKLDLPTFMGTCHFIRQNYLEYKFSIGLSDETILCLASCVHHFRPIKDWVEVFAFFPEALFKAMDILTGALEYDWTKLPGHRYKDSLLIHFGTNSARRSWLYKREVFKLKRGPVRLSNCLGYYLLRANHMAKKIVVAFSRWLGKERTDVWDIYS